MKIDRYYCYYSVSYSTNMSVILVKVFFCLGLFLFFLFIFGKPAVERYLQGDVVLQLSSNQPEPLALPAITICVDMVRSSPTCPLSRRNVSGIVLEDGV